VTIKLVTDEKIAETSSKGNQEKWRDGGRWYKLDQFGYEGLAETMVSRLLEYSNVESDMPFRFVRYRMERVNAHRRDRTGCSSADFLKPGESIVTLAHLFRRMDLSLMEKLKRLPSDKQRIEYLALKTAELTGLDRFPQYLTMLFEVDGLFLNDDRHLNNIAVLEKDGCFDYCPIFDNGAGLLSNTQTAQMDIEPKALIRTVKASPFQTTFNRQIIHVRKLFGSQLRIPQFTEEELLRELTEPLSYYAERDRSIIAERVCQTILIRQKENLCHLYAV